MQKTQLLEAPVIEAKAWQIDFSKVPAAESVRITSPIQVFAHWTSVGTNAPPALARVADKDNRPLAILWMPPNAAPEVEAGWLACLPPADSNERVIRAGLRTARVVWTDRFAIVYTAQEQLEEALDAVIRFTIVERDTAAMEAKMPSIWASIDADTVLTHTVLPIDHELRRTAVGKTTELVTKMAGAALRMETALEQLDPALMSSSKRLFAELVLQAGLDDRLELLGEPIDFAIEHYELINSRMIEAKQILVEADQFAIEKKQFENERRKSTASLVVEVAILAVLLADLALIAFPHLVN